MQTRRQRLKNQERIKMKAISKLLVIGFIFLLFVGNVQAATTPVKFNFSLDWGIESPFAQFNINFPDKFQGLSSTFGYCSEYTQGISSGHTYLANTHEVEGNYLKAAWLIDTYAPNGTNNDRTITALQAAIWNVLGYNNAEKPKAEWPKTTKLYNEMIASVSKISDFSSFGLQDKYEILIPYKMINGETKPYQDLIVKAPTPPTPTPIPAAAWIFGSGIVGLLGLRRKRTQA